MFAARAASSTVRMRGKVSQAEVPQLVVYSLTASNTSCGFEPVKERTTSTISRQGLRPQACGPPKSAASRILRSYSGTTVFQLSVMIAIPFRFSVFGSEVRRLILHEIENKTVERGGMLDLRPMSAAREDMHLRIRHDPSHLQADIERAETIVHAPDHEEFRLELAEIGGERFARQLALPLAKQLDDFRIDARLVALLENLVGEERGVVDDGGQQLAQLLAAWAAAFVIAPDHLHAFDRRRREDRRHGAAADNNDPLQHRREIESEFQRDLAAHRIADDMRLFDAELAQESAQQLRIVFQPRLRQDDLVALAVLRHVEKDDAEFFGEGPRVQLEIAFGAGARSGAMDADQGITAAHLL